jgi:hypothetical protein
MRLRKRLVERAIEHAANKQWDEAINDNLRLIELGKDAEALNRLGKAYFELGEYDRALAYFRETLQTYPSNVIARKNITRLELLQSMAGAPERTVRQHADPQIFIVETGKTALTTLTGIAANDVVMSLMIGEELAINHDGKNVTLTDNDGHLIGSLEPQLAQRLIQMLEGGNRYVAVVANLQDGLVKVLIRETYQAPYQRTRVSFPGKLGGDIAHFRTYVRDVPLRYELDADELQEDDDLSEDEVGDDTDEDFFRGDTHDEEEVGLEEIEADLAPDEDEEEES